MITPTFCKQLFLAGCFSLLSLHSSAAKNAPPLQADKTIKQLYHKLNNKPTSDLSARIETISARFLGKPYLLTALGEGAQGYYDQTPLYRTDAFDCETYVDTVLALTLANNPVRFKQCINQIRYQNGHVSFTHRNHFTCLDWNKNNERQGFIKDITATLHDKNHQPVVQFAHARINKPGWYNHFSANIIRLEKADVIEQAKRLELLKQEGKKLPVSTSIIPYIPLSILFTHSGEANMYLFDQIPNATIVEIVRPNWDLTKKIGTNLNVSHLGFVFRHKGTLLFREASSEHGRVLDVSLIDYLRDAQKSPTIKGINIQQVQLPEDKPLGSCE